MSVPSLSTLATGYGALTSYLGLQSRTLEVLQALGLRQELDSKGNRVGEVAFWGRDSGGKLSRENIGTETVNPTPYPYTLIVDQGTVESVFEADLKKHDHSVTHRMELLDYNYDELDDTSWPITAFIKNNTSGAVELWHTSYILGADGSNSKVRHLTSIATTAYGSEATWAIADLQASTTFPDIRRRSRIRSIHGSCVLVPNKARNSFRMTTILSPADLSTLTSKERCESFPASVSRHLASSTTLLVTLSSRLTAVLAPYTVSISSIDYINRYVVRKQLATRFSDHRHRIFLLGDAAHAHSPITKQSMNSGIMDAWNLSWKLALVLKGLADQELLATYQSERYPVAKACLDFDVAVDQEFGLRQQNGASAVILGEQTFEEAAGLTTGCGIRYLASLVVKEEVRVHLRKAIEPLVPGKRLLPLALTRHSDGNQVQLLDELPVDGRSTLLLFVGELLTSAVFASLAMVLESKESPIRVGTDKANGEKGLIKVILVHTEPHLFLQVQDLPLPFSREVWDVFEDVSGKAHVTIGISPKLGGLCLVRPDGVVGLVSNLDDAGGVKVFLEEMLGAGQVDGNGGGGVPLDSDSYIELYV